MEEQAANSETEEQIETIQEAEQEEQEEQGSSGTNPLSKNQEYDADLDQTQISMNSKEESTAKTPIEDASGDFTNKTDKSQISPLFKQAETEEQKIQPEDLLPPQNGS